jgi:hypothetical protein
VNALRLIPESGDALELTSDCTVLGRDASCDVRVDDKTVSRRHARIERREGAWFVVDQSSANGTFLEGEKIAEGALREGQELRLGTVAYRVVIEGDDEAPATVLMARSETASTLLIREPSVRPSPPPVVVAASSVRPAEPPGPPPAPPIAAPPRPAARAPVSGPARPMPRPIGPPRASQPGGEPARSDEAASPAPAAPARVPAQISEVAVSDLPSAQPVVVPDLIDTMASAKESNEPPPLASPAPAKGSGDLMPAPTLYLTIAATLLIALSTYFSLSTGKDLKDIKTRRNAAEYVKAVEDSKKYAQAKTLLEGGLLKHGKLKLCNKGSVPLQVSWLGAVYVKPEELPPGADHKLADLASGLKPAYYNSVYCGKDFKLVLAPGSEQDVSFSSATLDRCNWDGNALFFSLSLEGPEAAAPSRGTRGRQPAAAKETVWVSGLLRGAHECVSVGEGW